MHLNIINWIDSFIIRVRITVNLQDLTIAGHLSWQIKRVIVHWIKFTGDKLAGL